MNTVKYERRALSGGEFTNEFRKLFPFQFAYDELYYFIRPNEYT